MIIVIPMAGYSRSFSDVGYQLPKYELPLNGRTVFDHAVESFERSFNDAVFIFVTRGDRAADFVRKHVNAIGIKNFQIVDDPTPQGFAGTALKGLRSAKVDLHQPVVIHPVDTFRPDFEVPAEGKFVCYTEFCIAERQITGRPKTAFSIEPAHGLSARIQPSAFLSTPLKGTGLHVFCDAASFVTAYGKAQRWHNRINPFGAPTSKTREILEWVMVREIIKRHHKMHMRLINRDDVVFCGVPREYAALLMK